MPNDPHADTGATSPVEYLATDVRPPEEGMALCLSGGGYRAMVFHVGVLWRLYEANLLQGLKRISSVSGGSITAGVLGLNWNKLSFDPTHIEDDFIKLLVKPVREMASRTIDANSIIGGILLPGSISDKIVSHYREQLFGNATLQDLPDDFPRFVINATNVQSTVLWRFMKPYMRDYRVGEIKNPTVELAVAVAASSAFPPVLSPLVMKVDPDSFTPNTGDDLQERPYTSEVVLTDGGVYDNLGLETAYKRYKTILVSDAGGATEPEPEPKHDWARHAYRVLNIIDRQVRSLRKRQLIHAFETKERNGAYWGIRTDITHYGLPDVLPCPYARALELARTPTRLKRLPDERQEHLINWGYAVCDAAIRTWVDKTLPKGRFPYKVGVG